MRAADDAYEQYEGRYRETQEALDLPVDMGNFQDLWDARFISDENMAALVAATEGVDYEEALAWIQERDTS